MNYCEDKKIRYFKELENGPQLIEEMLSNKEFKPKMVKYLDNIR